jgi:hypothetical protein
MTPLAATRRVLRRVRYGEPIVVVTGLPRSGTSMMMQMLEAGGVAPLTDSVREADESNPRGYYELERVKDLEQTSEWAWLSDARGRAVKIIVYLVRFLPETFNYKVVFMHRSLDEILTSQTKMLWRLGEITDTSDARMKTLYVDHVARAKSYLAHRSCFEVLHMKYHDVLRDVPRHADELNRFLGRRLDARAMTAVVDPELHRNRDGSLR